MQHLDIFSDLFFKIVGALGFVISLLTFLLTRWERRKHLILEVSDGSDYDFSKGYTAPEDQFLFKDDSVVKIKLTNIGSTPILIKIESLEIKSGKYNFRLSGEDYWGMETMDELIRPISSAEIGIPLDTFLKKLEITSPEKYGDLTFNKLYPLKIVVKDHAGKEFKNNKYCYQESVGKFYLANERF